MNQLLELINEKFEETFNSPISNKELGIEWTNMLFIGERIVMVGTTRDKIFIETLGGN